ncbi:MAG: acyl-CoA thioesterase [Lautropia sp.]
MVHRLRVRWAEADIQGVVFNPHYLAYADVAITEYWRALSGGDRAWLDETWSRFYLVKSTLDYRAPARFDDELDVAARATRLGRSSLEIAFEVRRDGTRLVDGSGIYVHTIDGAPVAMSADLRARILAYERTPPLAS